MQGIKAVTPDRSLKIMPECLICLIITTRCISVWTAITRIRPRKHIEMTNIYFSQFRRLGNPRLGCQHGWVPVRDFFRVSTCSRDREEKRSLKAVILFVVALFSWPNYSPNPRLLTPSYWAIGFQHMNVGGTQTFILKQYVWQ